MTTFDKAVNIVFKLEGYDTYTNDPDDAGGATKYGITLATLREFDMDLDGDGDVDENDVKLISADDAKFIYDKNYWKLSQADKIKDEWVAIYHFDTSVNMGVRTACKLFQKSLNDTLHLINRDDDKLLIDGMIGPHTLSVVEIVLEKAPNRLYHNMIMNRVKRYVSFVKNRTTNLKYLMGWVNRSYHFTSYLPTVN